LWWWWLLMLLLVVMLLLLRWMMMMMMMMMMMKLLRLQSQVFARVGRMCLELIRVNLANGVVGGVRCALVVRVNVWRGPASDKVLVNLPDASKWGRRLAVQGMG
jgi:hypothetical protein